MTGKPDTYPAAQPKWLGWVQKLQAIAQNGLTFTQNPFDVERYQKLRQIAVEMAAHYSDDQPEVVLHLFSREDGYLTPRIDVRAAVFQGQSILMVREKSDGLWTLPGGFADVGDSPREAVEREVLEESGYLARAFKLAAVYDRNRHEHPAYAVHLYKLFFICQLEGGAAAGSIETDGAAFFTEDNLPDLSTGRVTRAQIRRMFEHYRQPDLPTDFD